MRNVRAVELPNTDTNVVNASKRPGEIEPPGGFEVFS